MSGEDEHKDEIKKKKNQSEEEEEERPKQGQGEGRRWIQRGEVMRPPSRGAVQTPKTLPDQETEAWLQVDEEKIKK